MSSPAKLKNNFAGLLARVERDFPDIKFQPDDSFRWSSETQTIYYNSSGDNPAWSLLHELGHMLNQHDTYKTDRRLVEMEVEAWETALKLSSEYDRPIDKDYVQDCIDSYRHWQYKRSACPVCSQTGLEKPAGQYRCINCRHEWKVTPNRFCRVYRRGA